MNLRTKALCLIVAVSLLANIVISAHSQASAKAYLIVIETEQLREAVQPLVDLAIYKGYAPVVESAPPRASGETQRSVTVRQWLMSQIDAVHASFVVLVGHPYDASLLSQYDTGGLLPMRYMYPDSTNHSFERENRTEAMAGAVPSDAWYLNGSSWNWDRDGDGFAGEEGDDVDAASGVFAGYSYALGRIPFSDASAVHATCEGIARGEVAQQMAGTPRALVTAAIFDFRNGLQGPVARDSAADASILASALRKEGVVTTTLFERDGILPSHYPSDGGLDRSAVKQELARGPWSLAFFAGHGGTQRSWWAADINGNHLFDGSEEGTDTQYWSPEGITTPVGLALLMGCSTAIMDGAGVVRGPEVSSLLAEGRAACCIGSTRITWGMVPNDAGETSTAQLGVFASLSGFTDSTGTAFMRATDQNLRQSDNSGTALWNAYAYGVYGDPSYSVIPNRLSPCVPDAPYLVFEGTGSARLVLQNTTSNPLEWKLEDIPSWLVALPETGTLGAATTAAIQFTVSPGAAEHDQDAQMVVVAGMMRFVLPCHLRTQPIEELSVTLRDEVTTWMSTLRFSGTYPLAATMVDVNGQLIRPESSGRFSAQVNLKEGSNSILVKVQLADRTIQVVRHVTFSPLERPIEMLTEDGCLTSRDSILIRGHWLPGRDVVIAGINARTAADGSFAANVPLKEGANVIRITASDSSTPAVTRCVIMSRTDSAPLSPCPAVLSRAPYWAAWSIRAIAVQPGDPSTIIVSLGYSTGLTGPGSTVLRTTDGGLTWRRLDLLFPMSCLAYDCFDPSTIYAGGTYGLWRSSDDGLTWDVCSDDLTTVQKEVRQIVADPNTAGVVWAGTYGGLLRSGNSGMGWTRVGEPVSISGLAVGKGRPAIIMTRTDDYSPWRISRDGGAHWETSQTMQEFQGSPMTADPSSTDTFWAVRHDKVCVTVDGGSNWSETPCSPDGSLSFDKAGMVLATCADMPAVAYVTWTGSGGGRLLRTIDGGATWSEIELPQAGIVGLAYDDTGSGLLLASAGDGMIHVSRDAGDTWVPAEGLGRCALSALASGMVNGKKQAVATDGFRASVSVDGGLHWNERNVPLAYGIVIKDPTLALAADRLILSGPANSVFELGSDGTWHAIGLLPAAVSVQSPDHGVTGIAFDGRTLYVAAGIDGLYKTIDDGVSWAAIDTGTWARTQGVYVSQDMPGLLFATVLGPKDLVGVPVTNDLLVSRDGGTSWASTGLTGITIRKVVFDPFDPSVVYAVSATDAWRSDDVGHHWRALELPEFDLEITDVAALGEGRLLLSTISGLAFSDVDVPAPELALTSVPAVATVGTTCFLACTVANNFRHLTRTFSIRASGEAVASPTLQPQAVMVTLKPGESRVVQVPWVVEDTSPSATHVIVTLSDGQESVLARAAADVHVSPRSYILTVAHTGSGSVAQTPYLASYTAGSVVTLTATPGTGYAFKSWSGALTGMANPVVVTLDADRSVTANFERIATLPPTSAESTLTLQIGNTRMAVVKSDSTSRIVTLDAAPVLGAGNRTLVPVRAVAEAMGGTVDWNATTRTATVTVGSNTLELTLGKNIALFNGTATPIDTDPKVLPLIINGRTMLPLRFVVESLGAQVSYDQATKTITITYTKT
jgi:hypothetical protein